ncbi:MAG: hypothetical protein ABSG32_23805 [Terriglobia bacterium]|jgi:hypothetical protein
MTLGFGQPVYALPFDRQTEVRANAIQRLICKEGPPLLPALLLKTLRDVSPLSHNGIEVVQLAEYLPMMSKTEQHGGSAGAMLRSGREQINSRARYAKSLNEVTQAFHTPVSSGETGTVNKRRSYDNDVEMCTSGLQLYTGGGETTL